MHILACTCPLAVTVQYDEEAYRVQEEDGSVTLALVLNRDTAVNVTVSVNTLDLLNSSIGDAANGELLEFCPLQRYILEGLSNVRRLQSTNALLCSFPEKCPGFVLFVFFLIY